MKLRTLALAAVAMFVAAGEVAMAQSKIFFVNEGVVRRESKIGKDMTARLGSMQQQGVQQLGLQTLEDEIRKEEEALKPLTQNLTKEALDKNPTLKERVTNLQKKQAEFVQKAQALNANLGQADGAASDQFIMAMMPAVKYVAEQAKAEVVLSSNAIWYGAPAVDLSSKVVQRLDATVPSYEAWVQAMQAQQAARAPAAGAAGVAPPAPR